MKTIKIAVIGSRILTPADSVFESLLPENCEIVSGGAIGVDTAIANYAKKRNIELTEILPDYKKNKKSAPLIRNREIIDMADKVLAFWDGISKGTSYSIAYAQKIGKPVETISF